ncbi:phosphate ABC transporter substrate-binding protein [uncultured Gimesia sp.]|uniref:phosphate ABC transporter substrate-binding protein n=1 Tax=uncultured Gimesia sp. TaxID=1678688 RepID=UPI00260603D8|nr:phosphate ABC transporter substrate-binding protein [uncultured Gimesia sp.]
MKHLTLIIAFVILPTTLCFSEEKPKPPANRPVLKRDIIGLWLMGQSLCEGAESLPRVTPTDEGWGNLMFQRGVRTWSYGKLGNKPQARPAEQFTFVPLTATKNGGLGETIANGMADHLKARLPGSPKNQGRLKNEAPHFLAAYAGQGGRLIDELSSVDQSTDDRTPASRQHGGGYYKTSLDDARRARGQAEAMGKDFGIAALIWMQGEANAGPTGGINPSRWGKELTRPTGQEWYRDRLIHYRKQWSRDLQKITGQTDEIPMFTYQTLSPAGEAQLMAADLDPHITMVGPHYMVPSAVNSRYAGRYGDPIHLSADGERWFGEQVAKVVHRVLIESEKWQPLRPRKSWIAPDRTSVLVEFQVPRPPLVLDETFLPREQYPSGDNFQSLYGFQIRDTTRAIMVIRSIEVESPNRIRIRLASPLKADTNYNLSYGLPYAGQIGKIVGVRKGPSIADQPTTELLINGNLEQQLKPLIAEGAFYVTNMLTGDAYARVPIRYVDEKEGTTILRFENRERRNLTDFETGQTLTTMRGFSYGNLRDSDPESAIYQFADSAYGNRVGQAYPLWNWGVLFNQFPISEK